MKDLVWTTISWLRVMLTVISESLVNHGQTWISSQPLPTARKWVANLLDWASLDLILSAINSSWTKDFQPVLTDANG